MDPNDDGTDSKYNDDDGKFPVNNENNDIVGGGDVKVKLSSANLMGDGDGDGDREKARNEEAKVHEKELTKDRQTIYIYIGIIGCYDCFSTEIMLFNIYYGVYGICWWSRIYWFMVDNGIFVWKFFITDIIDMVSSTLFTKKYIVGLSIFNVD